MIIAEEEAKTKICQEAISAQLPDDKVADASRCIGSACMAWRWKRGSAYVPDISIPGHFVEIEWSGDYSTTHGYCGKAGMP